MKKFVRIFVGVFLFMVFAPCVGDDNFDFIGGKNDLDPRTYVSDTEKQSDIYKPFVRVLSCGPDKDSMCASCTGQYVAPNLILTAAHCVEPEYREQFNIYRQDQKMNFEAKLIAVGYDDSKYSKKGYVTSLGDWAVLLVPASKYYNDVWFDVGDVKHVEGTTTNVRNSGFGSLRKFSNDEMKKIRELLSKTPNDVNSDNIIDKISTELKDKKIADDNAKLKTSTCKIVYGDCSSICNTKNPKKCESVCDNYEYLNAGINKTNGTFPHIIDSTCFVWPGNSGGGVIDQGNNKVLYGVVSHIRKKDMFNKEKAFAALVATSQFVKTLNQLKEQYPANGSVPTLSSLNANKIRFGNDGVITNDNNRSGVSESELNKMTICSTGGGNWSNGKCNCGGGQQFDESESKCVTTSYLQKRDKCAASRSSVKWENETCTCKRNNYVYNESKNVCERLKKEKKEKKSKNESPTPSDADLLYAEQAACQARGTQTSWDDVTGCFCTGPNKEWQYNEKQRVGRCVNKMVIDNKNDNQQNTTDNDAIEIEFEVCTGTHDAYWHFDKNKCICYGYGYKEWQYDAETKTGECVPNSDPNVLDSNFQQTVNNLQNEINEQTTNIDNQINNFDPNASDMDIINLLNDSIDLNEKKEQLEALQQAYDDAKAKEQSLSNRALTALSVAAAGLGGMQLAQGLAEQKADKDAAADMAAYMATFRCTYGDGKSVKGGMEPIELPGGNDAQMMKLRSEYFALAASLKERKESLGMKPGIESEEILDKAQMGLYDDENTGITGGNYASIYRAQMGSAEDQSKIDESKDKSSKRVKIGGTVAGIGVVGGALGNSIINGKLGEMIKDAKANKTKSKEDKATISEFKKGCKSAGMTNCDKLDFSNIDISGLKDKLGDIDWSALKDQYTGEDASGIFNTTNAASFTGSLMNMFGGGE